MTFTKSSDYTKRWHSNAPEAFYRREEGFYRHITAFLGVINDNISCLVSLGDPVNRYRIHPAVHHFFMDYVDTFSNDVQQLRDPPNMPKI